MKQAAAVLPAGGTVPSELPLSRYLPDPHRFAPLVARIDAYVASFLRRHGPVFLVLLVALAVRWPDWDTLHYYGDDAEYAIVAGYLAEDPRFLAYPRMEQFAPTPFVSQPPLILYLFALGGKLTGDMETGAVMVSMLLGVATCAVLYAIGVALGRPGLGVTASAFLAFAPMHVDLSRRAFLDVGLTFFMTLAVLCFVHWANDPSPRRASYVGAAAGATALSKLPGVLIYPILAVPFLWLLLRKSYRVFRHKERVPGDVGRLLGHAGIVAAFGAFAAGLYLGFLAYLEGLANLETKLGWQAERLGGEDASKPWHYYFSSPGIGVSDQFGILFFLLAFLGVFRLLRSKSEWGDRHAGVLAVVAWPVIVTAFFVMGSRKQWFYILPVVPAIALLGALMVLEIARYVREWGDEMTTARTQRFLRVAGIVLILAFLTVPLGQAVAARPTERPWGYGVKEAAFLIDERDPDAGQVGTLLGRFTLHFYNEHPTYHWYNNHSFVDREIQAGRVRFIVLDTYLNVTHETEWMEGLAKKHGATIVAEYVPSNVSGRVIVYEVPRIRP